MIVRAWLGVSVGSVLLLTGCGQINKMFDNDDGGKYTRSGSIQSLDLPPDLTAPQYDSTFTVNNVNGAISAQAAGAGLAGRSATVLPESVAMAFKGQGNGRYLEVDMPANTLWQKVQGFWSSTGVKLKRDEASIGVMETDWIETRGNLPQGGIQKLLGRFFSGITDAGIRDRYTVRFERAGNKTNIYMTHRGAEQIVTDSGSKWEMRPARPEAASEMLNRLQAYLQANAKKTKPVTTEVKRPPVQPVKKAVIEKPRIVNVSAPSSLSLPKPSVPTVIEPTLDTSVALSTAGTLGADVVNLPKRQALAAQKQQSRPRPVKVANVEKPVAVKKAVVPALEPVVSPQTATRLAFLSTTNDGQPALGVRANYTKVWAQTEAVLKKSGFTIDGKSVKNGLYGIQYQGINGKKALIKKGSKQILHVIKVGKVTAMRLLDINGKPLDKKKAATILRSIEQGFNGT